MQIREIARFAAAGLSLVCASVASQTSEGPRPPADMAALVAQDAELNAAYRAAEKASAGDAATELRAAQRKWIQARNELCGLTTREAAARDWPANLQGAKADCVMRVTQVRLAALRQHRPVASLQGFTDHDKLLPIQEYTFPIGKSTGKWYAEIEVNRDVLVRQGDRRLHLGLDNVDGFYALSGDARLQPEGQTEVFGLAVDLDAHQLYWRSSVEAAGRGVPLNQGTKPYALKVKSDRDLEFLLSRGQVRINPGQRPFKYAIPAGYLPWHAPKDRDEPVRWIVPAYERVAGKDRPALANGYWDWLMGRDASQNPTNDRTGALCALQQGPDTWYLAGAAEADRIERRCTVPFGRQIVVPVMAVFLSFDTLEMCKANEKLASLSPYTLHNTFMELDGQRFDRVQDYAASVWSCAEHVAAGKLVTRHVLWLGMWVPLQPLPRGEHVITFGGRFNALNLDRRVTYRVVVE